jgi:hypothetical protein
LYIATTLATIYVLCCLGLLVGTLRNRHEFFVPWLVVDFFGTVISVSLMIGAANKDLGFCLNEKWEYWGFCVISTAFNLIIWYVVKLFYNNLQHMTKLREVAVVAIPCPSPNSKQVGRIILEGSISVNLIYPFFRFLITFVRKTCTLAMEA